MAAIARSVFLSTGCRQPPILPRRTDRTAAAILVHGMPAEASDKNQHVEKVDRQHDHRLEPPCSMPLRQWQTWDAIGSSWCDSITVLLFSFGILECATCRPDGVQLFSSLASLP